MHTVAMIGTRAQAIKMAPVVHALRNRGVTCEIVLTGQHTATVDDLLSNFDLVPNTQLWGEGEVKTIPRGIGWMPRLIHRTTRHLTSQRHRRPITVLVHGDTMTALVGAIAGRISGNRVAHVEAGLRSGSLLDPFPEEAIRRFVTSITDDAYCPGESYVRAARGRMRRCIDTGENTVLDAVRWAVDRQITSTSPADGRPYVILSAHRMETVIVRRRLRALVHLALGLAQEIDVYFVLHPITEDRLRRTRLLESMEMHSTLHLLPRMDYTSFISLASRATAVLTDGGGNQEEMSYLGIPTLLLRRRTERAHGLGRTTFLTGIDLESIRERLRDTIADDPPVDPLKQFGAIYPSAVIAEDIAARSRVTAETC